MKARNVVVLLVVLCAFYALLIGDRGVVLLSDPRLAAKGLGIGTLLLPVVGAVLVFREVQFGRATERLGRILPPDPHQDDARPDDAPPARTPSGRAAAAAADAAFIARKAEVEAAPDDWSAWYRLAVAYGNARDTRRGRRAMRMAIAVELASRDGRTGQSNHGPDQHGQDQPRHEP